MGLQITDGRLSLRSGLTGLSGISVLLSPGQRHQAQWSSTGAQAAQEPLERKHPLHRVSLFSTALSYFGLGLLTDDFVWRRHPQLSANTGTPEGRIAHST